MKTAGEILIIVLLFSIFAFLHSFLASNKIKRNITEKTGKGIAFYRLFYNALSVVILAAFYEISPKPGQLIYELMPPYDIIIFILQAIALAGVLRSFYEMDFKELAGISQLIRYYKGEYKCEELDGNIKLNISGLHKISRHPIYFFIILFLAFRPYMDLFYLVIFICTIIYLYIGSHFEEKKLIEKFGLEYLDYKKRVPRIFPVKF